MTQIQKNTILLRKLLHLSLGIAIIGYMYLANTYSPKVGLNFLLLVLVAYIIYEILRLETPFKVPFHYAVKEQEITNHTSGLILLLSIIISFSAFSYPIAASMSLIALLGDTVSALGALYGTHKIGGPTNYKTWEGFIGQFIISVGILFIFIGPQFYIIVLALLATIIETYLRILDDNLVVPLLTGAVGQLLYTYSSIIY